MRQGVGYLGWLASVELGKTQEDGRLSVERDGEPTVTSATSPRGQSDVHEVTGSFSPSPFAAPAPAAPPLFVQVPSPPSRCNFRQ